MNGGPYTVAKRYLLAGVSVLSLMLAGAAPAGANGSVAEELAALRAEVQALRREVNEAKAQAAAAAKAASSDKTAGGDIPDLKVKWKGAPELSSTDGNFKFKFRGRVQTDANFVDQDTPITGARDVNATRIRRARLGVQGTVWKDIDYILEADFADNKVALADAYLQYTGLPADIRIGHFKTFNSLEEMYSTNYITFMERAAFMQAFELGVRRIGVGTIYDENKHWTLAAGYFGGPASEIANDESEAFGARATFAPINREGRVLHLGGSVRHRNAGFSDPSVSAPPASNTLLFTYAAQAADLSMTGRFVNTGAIGESDTFWGLELAGVWGPFSMQGEYGHINVDTPFFIEGNPTFDGWYADASWFLTGETRPYANGVFGRVKVKNPVFKGGPGAWQVAGRYDVANLSNNGGFTCPACGTQKTWLVGVNWYLNDNTRLMLNYNESNIDGGVNDGADIKGLGMRAQVDW
jgi:phosphate-selective porin OprO and OprP